MSNYIYNVDDGYPCYSALTLNINLLEKILEKDKFITPVICVNQEIYPKEVYDNWCKENIHLKDKYPNIFSLKWLDI